jgi:hypothetical protein
MKTIMAVFFALLLIGCASSRQNVSLTADQAKTRAMQLANDKAFSLYQCRPFQSGEPARFVAGHWTWKQLGAGDIEGTVELAADGSTNSVTLNQLADKLF